MKWQELCFVFFFFPEEGNDKVGEVSTVPLGTCKDPNVKCMSNATDNGIHELAKKNKP